jgi:hypothetical protein
VSACAKAAWGVAEAGRQSLGRGAWKVMRPAFIPQTGRLAEMRGRHPARHCVVMIAVGHEEIRRGQHRQRDVRVAH